MFRDPAPDPVERLRLLFPSNDLVAENCRGMKIGRIRSLLNIYGAFCIVDRLDSSEFACGRFKVVVHSNLGILRRKLVAVDWTAQGPRAGALHELETGKTGAFLEKLIVSEPA